MPLVLWATGEVVEQPEGLKVFSPGQRPGAAKKTLPLALKGRNTFFCPVGALVYLGDPFPRALPWAEKCQPVGLQYKELGYVQS